MDIATIIGIVAGFGLITVTIMIGGGAAIFVNVPSLVVVLGGTLAATLINYPLSDVLGVVRTVKNAFMHKGSSPSELIEQIVSFATVARREGILALETRAKESSDEFLSKSVQLAVDGTAPELIKDILTTEIAFMEERHTMGQSILSAMGSFGPRPLALRRRRLMPLRDRYFMTARARL